MLAEPFALSDCVWISSWLEVGLRIAIDDIKEFLFLGDYGAPLSPLICALCSGKAVVL